RYREGALPRRLVEVVGARGQIRRLRGRRLGAGEEALAHCERIVVASERSGIAVDAFAGDSGRRLRPGLQIGSRSRGPHPGEPDGAGAMPARLVTAHHAVIVEPDPGARDERGREADEPSVAVLA